MDKRVERVQELRRSNAASAIPARKERKGRSRSGKKANAIRNERNAG